MTLISGFGGVIYSGVLGMANPSGAPAAAGHR